MFIETEETVLMDENEDYASTLIGGIWLSFKSSIPEVQANILTKGFNFIYLSDPDTLVQNQITEILVSETHDTSVQKLHIFTLITNTLIDVLKGMGFILNSDEISIDRLEELCNIVSFFYDLNDYEDVIGLADLLDAADIPPANRFLLAMEKYLGENTNLEVYELLLEDVSEVTITTLRNGLKGMDPHEEVAPSLVKRIRDNHETFQDTAAFRHVLRNGRVGGSVEGYLNFFKSEFIHLLEDPTTDKLVQYGKEVIAIYLLSEVNNHRLRDEMANFFGPTLTDHIAMIKIDNLINHLVLDHDQA